MRRLEFLSVTLYDKGEMGGYKTLSDATYSLAECLSNRTEGEMGQIAQVWGLDEWDAAPFSAMLFDSGLVRGFLARRPDLVVAIEPLVWAVHEPPRASGINDGLIVELMTRGLVSFGENGNIRLPWEVACAVSPLMSEIPPTLACILGRMPSSAIEKLRIAWGLPLLVNEGTTIRSLFEAYHGPALIRHLGDLPAGCLARLFAMVDRPDDVITLDRVKKGRTREELEVLARAGLVLRYPRHEDPGHVLPLDVMVIIAALRCDHFRGEQAGLCTRIALASGTAQPMPAWRGRDALRIAALLSARSSVQPPLPEDVQRFLLRRSGPIRPEQREDIHALALLFDPSSVDPHPLDLPDDVMVQTLLRRALRGFHPIQPAIERLLGVVDHARKLLFVRQFSELLDAASSSSNTLFERIIASVLPSVNLSLEQVGAIQHLAGRTAELVEGRMGLFSWRFLNNLSALPGGATIPVSLLAELAWQTACGVAADDHASLSDLSREWRDFPAPVRPCSVLMSRDTLSDAAVFVDAFLDHLLAPLGLAVREGAAGVRLNRPILAAVVEKGPAASADSPPVAGVARAPVPRMTNDGNMELSCPVDAPIALTHFLCASLDPMVHDDALVFRFGPEFVSSLPPFRQGWLARHLRAGQVSAEAAEWIGGLVPAVRSVAGVTFVEADSERELAVYLAANNIEGAVLARPSERTAVLGPRGGVA